MELKENEKVYSEESFDSAEVVSGVLEEFKLDVDIKYFNGDKKLEKIEKGDWIDLYANEDVFIPINNFALIPLGFAMKLPEGCEAHLAPRSSTFKKWGIIQTNSIGIIDESYCGDGDEWKMPVYCLMATSEVNGTKGTLISKGDKVAQFRIMSKMPKINFNEVSHLSGKDRGGFGSTGSR